MGAGRVEGSGEGVGEPEKEAVEPEKMLDPAGRTRRGPSLCPAAVGRGEERERAEG